MKLLPVLDRVATAEKVRDYLNKDYPQHCMAVGKPVTYIQATAYDGMPKSPSFGNQAEEEIIDRLDEVWEVQRAIDYTRDAFKLVQSYNPEVGQLLYDSYIRHKSREHIAIEMGYSKRSVETQISNACCQFAGCLANVSNGEMDLRVWQK